jgi:uncharacterized membrane protein YozB (DUF420 family)
MDPKLLYWAGALINFGVITLLVANGVRLARRGEVARHERSMTIAAALVVGFLVSYAFKLVLLGREHMSIWSAFDVNVLRFHEFCVATMLVAGGVAFSRAWRMRATRRVTQRPDDPETPQRTLSWHRGAGWTAAVGALLGMLSAFVVLSGMISRAGL